MSSTPSEIYLGTVALEPNRWGTVRPDRSPSTALAPLLGTIDSAGFDGLEVWENHLSAPISADDALAVRSGPVPVKILNSYVSLDEADPGARTAVGELAAAVGATGIKFNVGNDAASAEFYAEQIEHWVRVLPDDISLLCECHEGISIAEDPAVAAKIFEAAGRPDRLGAIVHTHESADLIARRFDAYGDYIRHVHINFLDISGPRVPPIGEVADRLGHVATQLRERGFNGTWTLEFVDGILSERDTPDELLAQAVADLDIVREVLA